jgi:hypothetical protein
MHERLERRRVTIHAAATEQLLVGVNLGKHPGHRPAPLSRGRAVMAAA